MSPRTIRIATRGSPLAIAQTESVRSALVALHPDRSFEIRVISTQGDRMKDRPLPEIWGKGLFTADLEEALRTGDVDMAVHSVKDLPVDLPSGLRLGPLPERVDPRDVLISREGKALDGLPRGSRIGTSSPRRRAQVLRWRRDLDVVPLRGNIETRIRKVREGKCDATILAYAGLIRLGLESEIAEVLEPDRFLPPAGQGAIGMEIREGDEEVLEILSVIRDASAWTEVEAETACLRALGGGCRTPIGASARAHEGALTLVAGVWSVDGDVEFRAEVQGPIARATLLGEQAADALREQGAEKILSGGEG